MNYFSSVDKQVWVKAHILSCGHLAFANKEGYQTKVEPEKNFVCVDCYCSEKDIPIEYNGLANSGYIYEEKKS